MPLRRARAQWRSCARAFRLRQNGPERPHDASTYAVISLCGFQAGALAGGGHHAIRPWPYVYR